MREEGETYTDISTVLAVGKARSYGGPGMKELKEQHGIGVVVDLNNDPAEAKEARSLGLKYFGKRLSDISAPSLDALESLAKTIDEQVRGGRKVYVHCLEAKGRSPTVAAAYLIYKGMKMKDAVRHIKDRRPIAWPEGLGSREQLAALDLFEHRIRTRSNPAMSNRR